LGQTKGVEKKTAKNSIEKLSIREIDSLFDIKNNQSKINDLKLFMDDLFKEMNGSALIVINDTFVIRKTKGVIRFYDHKKGYETWTKEEMNRGRKKKENQLQRETLFDLASIAKQFTAAAVLKLVSEKKITLKDTLAVFFPKIPYPQVTIHQLLSHTSGIPDYIDFPEKWSDVNQWMSNAELIELLIAQKPPVDFLPGTNFAYCNTNYALLASIVAQVSNMTFEEYMRQNIFIPAGLTNTLYITELEDNKKHSVAKGHLRSREELAPDFYQNGVIGDKGLYSNPDDLYKWKIAFFDLKNIIPAFWVEKATVKENYIKGKAVAREIYGYGLHIEENAHYGKLIYHGGLWRGFHNLFIYRPSDNVLIIYLSNYRNRSHNGKGNEVLHILDGA
jgi:CubicO group peptidase (beta-lactamase class C family)